MVTITNSSQKMGEYDVQRFESLVSTGRYPMEYALGDEAYILMCSKDEKCVITRLFAVANNYGFASARAFCKHSKGLIIGDFKDGVPMSEVDETVPEPKIPSVEEVQQAFRDPPEVDGSTLVDSKPVKQLVDEAYQKGYDKRQEEVLAILDGWNTDHPTDAESENSYEAYLERALEDARKESNKLWDQNWELTKVDLKKTLGMCIYIPASLVIILILSLNLAF